MVCRVLGFLWLSFLTSISKIIENPQNQVPRGGAPLPMVLEFNSSLLGELPRAK